MDKLNVVTAVFGTDWILPPEHADLIRRVDERVKLSVPANQEQLAEVLPDAEVIFGRWLTADELQQAPNLRWIQLPSAGANSALEAGAAKSDIILTTSVGIHAIQISEYVLGMMLMFARRMHEYLESQRNNCWNRTRFSQIDELHGKTLGIVGLGAIGRGIARKAKAFDMTVLATKRTIDKTVLPDIDELLPADKLDDLLKRSDYVVLAVPLTSETTNLIGPHQLELMKPSAILINVARGPVVDEPALIDALREKKIAGAGLDTFTVEPLPKESPLWNMPNVIITPHMAGTSPQYWLRATELFCDNLRRYIDGKPLRNVVDRARGY